jgi:predicted N-acetyltransferase YhbS
MKPEAKMEENNQQDITVRLLQESDLAAADRVMRLAFGTFIGLPEPTAFMGDAAYVRPRWTTSPESAFAAVADGEIIGSNFATNWGSVGFFGPLTIRPDFWDRGVGKRLMEPVMNCLEKWGTRHAGLFTFPHSAKHVGLYQQFGFWPRFLTAMMSKSVQPNEHAVTLTKLSETATNDRGRLLAECRELTDGIYDGLDLTGEIAAVAEQKLGDTLLLSDNNQLNGFAICHFGAGTEGGSETCYVKFAAARTGPNAERNFGALLDGCEAMAVKENLPRVLAGVNTARHEAYRYMLSRGFRTDMQGVVMSRPNETGYNRTGVYLIDDWR